MTLAFINTLKQVKPDLRIILAAQGWMRDLMGAGLVDEFVECHLPWVGSGTFSIQKWKNFYKSLKRICQLEPSIAVETRGDWRNFFIFRILQVPKRLGTPMSGGRVFLTHETSGQELMAPLWTSRIKLLEAFGVKKPLVLPPGPPPAKMQPLSDRFLIVHPGASQPLRQMDESQLKVVLSSGMNLSDLILVACGPNEKALQDKFKELIRKQGYRAEAWSGGLSDFFGLCQAAAAVFTMDSGPAHIAAWAGAKLTVFCNHDAPETVKPLTRIVLS
jgi:ADP-heptose:LPS heptosyltransferase